MAWASSADGPLEHVGCAAFGETLDACLRPPARSFLFAVTVVITSVDHVVVTASGTQIIAVHIQFDLSVGSNSLMSGTHHSPSIGITT